ncbi:MAG: DUF4097 family beta strand repeat protein [Candidatus Marinimicrobia bacterium]|nr:DUF4097 family beta strand repeat protein [Candidatus Neomarinimicrobiota bacterium]
MGRFSITVAFSLMILIAFTFMMLAGTLIAADKETLEGEFKVKPGQTLEVDFECGGSLELVAWDKKVVAIKARIRGGDPQDFKIRMGKIPGGVRFTASQDGLFRNHPGHVDVIVKVPEKFNLDFNSMGGDLDITGVQGEFIGETMGGDITLTKVKGEASLRTMGGDIIVRESHLDGKVHTMGGDVTFKDVSGGIDGSTMGGDVSYSNRVAGGQTENEVKISSMGGDIMVDEAPAGVRVRTMGGDIHIRSAGDHVKASTMGGDIAIDEVSGWVKASTMGGDVEVTITGDGVDGQQDVNLESKGGDIILRVPADLSMDIEIRLGYSNKYRDRYTIQSDFPLDLEESEEWKLFGFEKRKTLIGRGKTGDGRNKIIIETINGNVHLIKS